MKQRQPSQNSNEPRPWFSRLFGRTVSRAKAKKGEQPKKGQPKKGQPTVKVSVWVSPQGRSDSSTTPPPVTPAPKAEQSPRPKISVWVSDQGRSRPASNAQPSDLAQPSDPFDDFDDEFDQQLDEFPTAEGGNVRLLVSPKPSRHWRGLSSLLVLVFWLGSGGVVALGGWVGFWLIVNPSRLGWASAFFPQWKPDVFIRDDAPRSLSDLRAEAGEQGLILGKPLLLKPSTSSASPSESPSNSTRSKSPHDLLIPVFMPPGNCGNLTSNCSALSALTELRVYRPLDPQPLTALFPDNARLRLLDRLAVDGPSELFVVSPLAKTTSAGRGSTRQLPLSQLSPIEGNAPGTGMWFLLSGEQRRGTTAIRYGHVGYYDGQRGRLSLALPWTSPAGKLPRWQSVTENTVTELVVDQTTGLDPWFLVYRVAAVIGRDPTVWVPPERLELIALNRAALKLVPYEQALLLAQNGLWTPALKQLQRVKQQRAASWSTTAADQMAVVALHAAFTKREADRDRASSSQRLLAQMIDGRWDQALQQLPAALEDGLDLSTLLESNSNRLQQRISAALTVEPTRVSLQTWGGLVVYARQGRDAAIAWLQRQNRASVAANSTSPLHRRTQQVLEVLDDTLLAQTGLPNPPSRLIGSATPLTSVRTSDWTTPQQAALPPLPDGQVWYRIQVARIHDGQGWQRSPFSTLRSSRNTPRFLWHVLGWTTNPDVQILTWDRDAQSQTVTATIRAMRLREGTLSLLASGEAMPSDSARRPNLSLTSATLVWQNPDTSTLGQLQQQQPATAIILAANLRRALRQAGQLPDPLTVASDAAPSSLDETPASPADSPSDPMEGFSDWSVAQIDLTGDNQPETVLNLNTSSTASETPADSPTTDAPTGKTLIFSAQGRLIYSELSQQQGQRMVAIATIDGDRLPSLLINRANTYSLYRWSATKQQFE